MGIKCLRPAYGDSEYWPEIEATVMLGGEEYQIELPVKWWEELQSLEARNDQDGINRAFRKFIDDWLESNPAIREKIAKYQRLFAKNSWAQLVIELNLPKYAHIKIPWLTQQHRARGVEAKQQEGRSLSRSMVLESEAGNVTVEVYRRLRTEPIEDPDAYMKFSYRSNLLQLLNQDFFLGWAMFLLAGNALLNYWSPEVARLLLGWLRAVHPCPDGSYPPVRGPISRF